MNKVTAWQKKGFRFPVLLEKGEDGYFVAQCPILESCYTQGRTKKEALSHIREVIDLVLEEKEAKENFALHSGSRFYFEMDFIQRLRG